MRGRTQDLRFGAVVWTSTETETSVGLVQNWWCCHGNGAGLLPSLALSPPGLALINNNGGHGVLSAVGQA